MTNSWLSDVTDVLGEMSGPVLSVVEELRISRFDHRENGVGTTRSCGFTFTEETA